MLKTNSINYLFLSYIKKTYDMDRSLLMYFNKRLANFWDKELPKKHYYTDEFKKLLKRHRITKDYMLSKLKNFEMASRADDNLIKVNVMTYYDTMLGYDENHRKMIIFDDWKEREDKTFEEIFFFLFTQKIFGSDYSLMSFNQAPITLLSNILGLFLKGILSKDKKIDLRMLACLIFISLIFNAKKNVSIFNIMNDFKVEFNVEMREELDKKIHTYSGKKNAKIDLFVDILDILIKYGYITSYTSSEEILVKIQKYVGLHGVMFVDIANINNVLFILDMLVFVGIDAYPVLNDYINLDDKKIKIDIKTNKSLSSMWSSILYFII